MCGAGVDGCHAELTAVDAELLSLITSVDALRWELSRLRLRASSLSVVRVD